MSYMSGVCPKRRQLFGIKGSRNLDKLRTQVSMCTMLLGGQYVPAVPRVHLTITRYELTTGRTIST